ncbi:hypothetical protein ACNAN0_02410 [Agrilactobacillus fermenti]|uniref:hypothetical protein n=1 Tax=Agrilactobacillus fermenti TaxID=2586909 RepID=UPI003A5C15D7
MPLWFNDKDDEIISIEYQDEQAVSYGQTREARQYPVYVVRTKSKRMLVLPAQQFIADYVDTEPEEDDDD